MRSAALEDRIGAAGMWCQRNGWVSVAHLRGGGAGAADALASHLKLRSSGARANRLKNAIFSDEWSWDVHAAAAARSRSGCSQRR